MVSGFLFVCEYVLFIIAAVVHHKTPAAMLIGMVNNASIIHYITVMSMHFAAVPAPHESNYTCVNKNLH